MGIEGYILHTDVILIILHIDFMIGARTPQRLRSASYVALAGAKHTMSACHALTGTHMSKQISAHPWYETRYRRPLAPYRVEDTVNGVNTIMASYCSFLFKDICLVVN